MEHKIFNSYSGWTRGKGGRGGGGGISCVEEEGGI